MNTPMMQRLRDETQALHNELEHTQFSLDLVKRKLPLSRYVGQLLAYRVVLGALETQLSSSTDPSTSAVWRAELAKVPLLERDLSFFGDQPARGNSGEKVANKFAERIHRYTNQDPAALLGILYVMEGSTLGAQYLVKHVRAAFNLVNGSGLEYYSSGDRTRWHAFAARMNETITDRPQQRTVLNAANVCYREVGAILAAV